jgi:hypothetical protein
VSEREGGDPKVVTLAPKDELKASGELLRRNLPTLMENAEIIAALKRAHYLAYLKAGFDEKQALELCKG